MDYYSPIIAGMEYARPDLPYEATEAVWPSTHPDIYRHPGSLHGGNVRSKKTYHIYSLGIILAEIACWQSIQQLLMMPVDQQADIFELIKVRETVMSKVLGSPGRVDLRP